jgi:hypothetical protein
MATSVQYGFQADLCVPLVDYFNTFGEGGLVEAFANYTNNIWYVIGLGTAEEYAYELSSKTI